VGGGDRDPGAIPLLYSTEPSSRRDPSKEGSRNDSPTILRLRRATWSCGICTGMSSIANAWNLPRTYHRNIRGPSHAPIAVGINIPSRYQLAMNGVASSGQCRV
jgi:hypothetical protein